MIYNDSIVPFFAFIRSFIKMKEAFMTKPDETFVDGNKRHSG